MAEIADLLKLWQNRRRASADVKRIALAHVADLDRRMGEMAAMKKTLDAITACRAALDANVAPLLAVEATRSALFSDAGRGAGALDLPAALRLAGDIASNPPLAVQRLKRGCARRWIRIGRRLARG